MHYEDLVSVLFQVWVWLKQMLLRNGRPYRSQMQSQLYCRWPTVCMYFGRHFCQGRVSGVYFLSFISFWPWCISNVSYFLWKCTIEIQQTCWNISRVHWPPSWFVFDWGGSMHSHIHKFPLIIVAMSAGLQHNENERLILYLASAPKFMVYCPDRLVRSVCTNIWITLVSSMFRMEILLVQFSPWFFFSLERIWGLSDLICLVVDFHDQDLYDFTASIF